MAVARKRAKQASAPKSPRKRPEPEIGPDGLTLSKRVHQLMTEQGVGQSDVARMCSEYYATFVPEVDERVKQQHIFNLINKGQGSAEYLPLLAIIFDVNDVWLQFGIGPKHRKDRR